MKKMICMICAVLFVSVIFCGCGDSKTEAAVEKVGDQVATIASEVKDNVDNMVEDGTVRDGDGYIGDRDTSTRSSTEQSTEANRDNTEDNGMFDPDEPSLDSTESDNDN